MRRGDGDFPVTSPRDDPGRLRLAWQRPPSVELVVVVAAGCHRRDAAPAGGPTAENTPEPGTRRGHGAAPGARGRPLALGPERRKRDGARARWKTSDPTRSRPTARPPLDAINSNADYWTRLASIAWDRDVDIDFRDEPVDLDGDGVADARVTRRVHAPGGILANPELFGLTRTPDDPRGRVGRVSVSTGVLGLREALRPDGRPSGQIGMTCFVCHGSTDPVDGRVVLGLPGTRFDYGLLLATSALLADDEARWQRAERAVFRRAARCAHQRLLFAGPGRQGPDRRVRAGRHRARLPLGALRRHEAACGQGIRGIVNPISVPAAFGTAGLSLQNWSGSRGRRRPLARPPDRARGQRNGAQRSRRTAPPRWRRLACRQPICAAARRGAAARPAQPGHARLAAGFISGPALGRCDLWVCGDRSGRARRHPADVCGQRCAPGARGRGVGAGAAAAAGHRRGGGRARARAVQRSRRRCHCQPSDPEVGPARLRRRRTSGDRSWRRSMRVSRSTRSWRSAAPTATTPRRSIA